MGAGILAFGPILLVSVEQGFVFSLLAIGVMLTFKILDIADLSVEGTFPLGAFVFAKMITQGLSPGIGMALGFLAGCLAGSLTYFLYKKVHIAALLSGILTMTILHTANLRITGKSNVPLLNFPNIFDYFGGKNKLIILFAIALVIKLLLDWFFKTEKGYLLTVTGDNEKLVRALGENPNKYTFLGLVLSNGLVSLSGSLMAQFQGYIDITMGQSMIVTALASIIIGDTLLKNSKKLRLTTRAILGAIIYRIIYGIALHIGLNPDDLKAITAFIVIIFIAYNNITAFRTGQKQIKKGKREYAKN
ncbi:MAG: ABC transporter permease [Tissierellia bacterium]|nr:ABC transporter permease [Tissierellia bacterium]